MIEKVKSYLGPRIRSYAFWLSVLAAIPMILQVFGVQVVADTYNHYVNTVLTILVALGILNNPTTDTKWYGDDAKG